MTVNSAMRYSPIGRCDCRGGTRGRSRSGLVLASRRTLWGWPGSIALPMLLGPRRAVALQRVRERSRHGRGSAPFDAASRLVRCSCGRALPPHAECVQQRIGADNGLNGKYRVGAATTSLPVPLSTKRRTRYYGRPEVVESARLGMMSPGSRYGARLQLLATRAPPALCGGVMRQNSATGTPAHIGTN